MKSPSDLPDSAPWVIGLTGPASAGKSTVAGILEGLGYVRRPMAAPLKAALAAILEAAGADQARQRALLKGGAKDLPCAELGGCSPRRAMQTLGTEWGRGMIDRDLWLRLAAARIAQELGEGRRVVIEDVRFSNEARLVARQDLPSEVWRVERPGVVAGRWDHVSELPISDPVDRLIDNHGSLEALEAQVLEAILG
jgi:hypothetical protein